MSVASVWKKHKLLAIVFAVYVVLALAAPGKALAAVKTSLYYVAEMLTIMPVIFILTSLIEAWVPKAAIINSFGKSSGFKGNILAFLLGSFSAGPIYAAFPVCKTLLKKGASINNIVIVLSTWAVIKVPMLANEAKFLGPDFMFMRWILTTIAVFLMGHIMSRRVTEADLPNQEQIDPAQEPQITVLKDYCIGCGLCARRNPRVFVVKDSKASVLAHGQLKTNWSEIRAIAEKCPGTAIIVKGRPQADGEDHTRTT